MLQALHGPEHIFHLLRAPSSLLQQDQSPSQGQGALTCTFVQEVCQETAHDSLVTDHKDVLLSLQLHDDWL